MLDLVRIMESDKFCLHWNDFAANISSALKDLRHEADLFDVTLACEDDSVKAHKLILSACSPFFRNIFKTNQHSHPLLYLRGIKSVELTQILNFIYYGEVNVAQEDLKSFLVVAEDLKIKGLTEQKDTNILKETVSNVTTKPLPKLQQMVSQPKNGSQSQMKKPLPNPFATGNTMNDRIEEQDDDVQEIKPLLIKQTQSLLPAMNDFRLGRFGDDSNDFLDSPFLNDGEDIVMTNDGNKDEIIDAMIESILVRRSHPLEGTMYECSVCQKQAKKKDKMQAHAEIHLKGFSHKCNICNKHYKTRPSLKVHISTTHKVPKEPSMSSGSGVNKIGVESILG